MRLSATALIIGATLVVGQTMRLPRAQAQMFLPGTFQVSDAGAAVYTIPIEVPPGTAGMQPSLSLQYTSGAGDGPLGVGWSLTGLPTVTRCPETVAQDGVRQGINFDGNDRFCIEGERLININGGAYGADGTEYRTERDGFSRIISHGSVGGGPAWFEVHTKAGQVMQFGNTPDSQVLAYARSIPRLWAVNQVSDTKGNYLNVTYTQSNGGAEFFPTRIDYGSNSTSGSEAYASVQFVYGASPEWVQATMGDGAWITSSHLLTDVETFVGQTMARHYKLAYAESGQAPSTQRSRLQSVTLCDTAGTCLPQTSFSWSDPAYTWAPSNLPATIYQDPGTVVTLAGDFNGDGKTDMVQANLSGNWATLPTCLSTGSGWSCGNPSASVLFNEAGEQYLTGDFNGDGKTDVVEANEDWGSFLTCLSTASGQQSGWNCNNEYANYVGGIDAGNSGYGIYCGCGSNTQFITGDFNGDGMTDIAEVNLSGAWQSIPTCLSTGSGWNCTNAAAPLLYDHQSGGQWLAGDFNGDGKTDLVLVNTSASAQSYRVCLSTANGNQASWQCSDIPATVYSGGTGFVAGDFNGDGFLDIAQVNSSGGWSTIPVCYSSGAYWQCGNDPATYVGGDSGPDEFGAGLYAGANFLIGDVNGDGRDDIIQTNVGWRSIPVCYWEYGAANGSGGYGAWQCRNDSAPNPDGSSGIYPGANFFVGDFNGDGKADIIEQNSGWSTYPVVLATGAPPDLITSISNGLGATTTLTYEPLTNNSVYTKGTASTYPLLDLQAPTYVVSQISTSNGEGGGYVTNYSYTGAKLDLSGRGFLGFQQLTATDAQTGIATTTNYQQLFPYTALVASRTKALGSQTLNSTTNTYSCLNEITNSGSCAGSVPGSVYDVTLSQSQEQSWDLNGAALPSVTTSNQYDSYGNATQVGVSTSDGNTKTTTNTYTNDTTNWFLGRLTGSSVTSTAP